MVEQLYAVPGAFVVAGGPAVPRRPERVRAFMALDKKRDSGGLRFVLLEDFERPVVRGVDDATVAAALDAIGLASTPPPPANCWKRTGPNWSSSAKAWCSTPNR